MQRMILLQIICSGLTFSYYLSTYSLQALYFFWIRSQINTDEMWKDLYKKVTALVNWKANLVQWKVTVVLQQSLISCQEKVIQLTYILKDFLYSTEKTRDQN